MCDYINDDDVHSKASIERHRKTVSDSYVSEIVNSGHSLCPI